ncbi:hypothetical protein AX774_g2684 [Zancudomyces culisetae]|uniref:Uncharacterized protein n=1 Tax=Zancudomyces culisetae TaxID=1213189 RepID=A0A1R1PSE2_ZANCU|nr:hypothetical protein AX774_g2684 [Zancudomyces culisetae]|eukprot:OMH83802.1 hypothetical protein AX774_g2684 [Zancudomyces culisetae]
MEVTVVTMEDVKIVRNFPIYSTLTESMASPTAAIVNRSRDSGSNRRGTNGIKKNSIDDDSDNEMLGAIEDIYEKYLF